MSFPRVRIGSDEDLARLEAVRDRHQFQIRFALIVAKRLLSQGVAPYKDTVPAHVIAKRRRRNKAARRARRLNR